MEEWMYHMLILITKYSSNPRYYTYTHTHAHRDGEIFFIYFFLLHGRETEHDKLDNKHSRTKHGGRALRPKAALNMILQWDCTETQQRTTAAKIISVTLRCPWHVICVSSWNSNGVCRNTSATQLNMLVGCATGTKNTEIKQTINDKLVFFSFFRLLAFPSCKNRRAIKMCFTPWLRVELTYSNC